MIAQNGEHRVDGLVLESKVRGVDDSKVFHLAYKSFETNGALGQLSQAFDWSRGSLKKRRITSYALWTAEMPLMT